jgi:hypothetical protein
VIKIVLARFEYTDLRTEHTKHAYEARFKLRLTDVTEARKVVPVKVRIENAEGVRIDSLATRMTPVAARAGVYETPRPIVLSSRARTPTEKRPADQPPGPLKILPGTRLVLVLDGNKFPYPIPLPSEASRGYGNPFEK